MNNQQSTPIVSVILTSFNHGRFIREAIESVLAQTYVNFELIILDDASTDDSWEIIQSFNDSRILAFRNSENLGPTYGVNKAIFELARGKYIAIHHSDDVWVQYKLQKQVEFLNDNPAIGAVFTKVLAIGEDGDQFKDKGHSYSSIFDRRNRPRGEWLRRFFIHGNCLCHPSILIRKECYEQIGGYRSQLAQLPDFDMWIRLLLKYDIHILDESLVHFRIRSNEQNTSGSRPETRIRDRFEHFKVLDNFRSIQDFDDLCLIFPEASQFYRGDQTDCQYALGLSGLEASEHTVTKLFSLCLIFDLLDEPVRADNIKSSYGFDAKSFIQISSKYDVFSTEEIIVLRTLLAEREGQISSLSHAVAEREGQISSLSHAVAEREGQISSLSHAVAEREGQIVGLSQNLGAIFESRSWRITGPLRWVSIQARLIKEHGLSCRLKAFLRKGARGVARRSIDYIRARPDLRVRLHGWALRLGLKEPLQSFYRKIQSRATDGIPNLRELVVTSYQAWREHFDTPPMEVLDKLAATSNSRAPVFIVARFEKTSEPYAESLAKSLVDSIGQPWSAVFLFSSDCNAVETIKRIKMATNGDSRICFDRSAVKKVAEIAILIEGGGLPRSHALYVFADALRNSPEFSLAYSDEDYLCEGNTPNNPWFKPEFSPLLASQGVLLGRMVALRIAETDTVGILEKLLSDSVDVAEFIRDYALALGEERALHIPHVLFHDFFAQRDPITVKFGLPEILPKATIIIPTKDRWDLLGPCLESMWSSDWPLELLDVVVVDNGSSDPETLTMLDKLESERKIRVIRDARQFNWSRLNNLAASESDGELLVFLNNDTEVDDPAWLKKLAAHALRPGVGAVGCKLLYPDRTVQHGGVIAGIHGVAGHAHLFIQADEGGYCNLANLDHEVSAVTGACLAVTRKNFELAGGFNEDFRVAFNDIVFCFTLHTLGLRNVYVSDPLLIHHESKSRGFDDTPEKLALQQAEARRTWGIHAELMRDDPFYSPNLSLWKPYELAFAPRRRAAWDDRSNRPLRVMMLSVTHAVGHGVPVVLALQAEALVKHGYEVIIAGPRSSNDFPYPGCSRLELHDPLVAATLAADLSVDLIIAHTPPFFSVAKWTGAYPPVIAYDYGEPPPEWFPDEVQRRAVLADKDLSLTMATAVYAISNAIAEESRTTVHGVIPLGNAHLGQWNEASSLRRKKVRAERGWGDRFVVLNVCRFHSGERFYKGVDAFVEVRNAAQKLNPDSFDRMLFVLCGKGSKEDVIAMTEKGLVVLANVTDEEMTDLYTVADAYANFSQWEGYNLGIGQALAMGLPTIASDIPAHRAFGIDVTNDVDMAAEWVLQRVGRIEERIPRIWGWDKPLSQLIEIVETVSAENLGRSW